MTIPDPTSDHRLKLDALAHAVSDAFRAQWTIRALRGPEWLDIPLAPSVAVQEALDAAWLLGVAAGIGNGVCTTCKQLKPIFEIEAGPEEGECLSCRNPHEPPF